MAVNETEEEMSGKKKRRYESEICWLLVVTTSW